MTDAPAAKDELLLAAAREYKEFHEALHGLNEEQTAEVWLGTWSIKEIVAHISGWHREMQPALERLARGERSNPGGVNYDNVDGWNDRFAAGARAREVSDLLLDLDRTHQDFMHAANSVPAERWEPGKTTYRIVDANTAEHYREHADQIRAWRTSRGV